MLEQFALALLAILRLSSVRLGDRLGLMHGGPCGFSDLKRSVSSVAFQFPWLIFLLPMECRPTLAFVPVRGPRGVDERFPPVEARIITSSFPRLR